MKNTLPTGHPLVKYGKIGVLLVNLGSPSHYTYGAMRRYLHQFLSDRRVIEVNPIIWKFLLNVVILTTRPSKSGKLYKSIWNEERNEAPLITTTRATTQKLQENIQKNYSNVQLAWAMRYGKPSIRSQIEHLKQQGCDRLLIMPLYPQYCASTTASVMDDCFDALKTLRWMPSIRSLPPYHDHPLYIDMLSNMIDESLGKLSFKPEKLIVSFHGIPESYFKKGDPYHCHCQKTSRLLKEKLNCDDNFVMTTFQSRFGKDPWLQPYSADSVAMLAQQGVKNIVVIAPGFSADCLETLEEIQEEIGDIFKDNGGENFAYIPCLNDSENAITLYKNLLKNELSGWL